MQTLPCLQAVLLGYVVRSQLIRAVREEYERTVREIEDPFVNGTSTHALTNCAVHWPRKKKLCLPEFLQIHPVRTDDLTGKEKEKSTSASQTLAVSLCPHGIGTSTRLPSPQEAHRLSPLSPSTTSGSSYEEEDSLKMCSRNGRTQEAATSLSHSDGPQHRTVQEDATFSSNDGSGAVMEQSERTRQTDEIENRSTLHSGSTEYQIPPQMEEVDMAEKDSGSVPPTFSAGKRSETRLSSQDSGECSVAPTCTASHFCSSAGSEVEGKSLSELVPPAMSHLPHTRQELLDLKSQIAMELVWVEQAIASRQCVSIVISQSFYVELCGSLLLHVHVHVYYSVMPNM